MEGHLTIRIAKSNAHHDVRSLREPTALDRRVAFWLEEEKGAARRARRARTLPDRAYWVQRWALARAEHEQAASAARISKEARANGNRNLDHEDGTRLTHRGRRTSPRGVTS